MAIHGVENNRLLLRAVRKTVKRKFEQTTFKELKGSHTTSEIKRYFYDLISTVPFDIYALTLNKKRVYNDLAQKKDRVYNYIARLVLDQIPIGAASTRIEFIIDKSKSGKETGEFNEYIIRQLKGRIDPRVPLDIYHYASHENFGLQAVDLFCWGIFRKYERNDLKWYHVFKEKIKFDDRFL